MTNMKCYRRAGCLVGFAVLAEGEIDLRAVMVSAIARLCCGEISKREYTWRGGGLFDPLTSRQNALLRQFVQAYAGDDRDRARGERLAIATIGDYWPAIEVLANRFAKGETVSAGAVRRLVGRYSRAQGAAK
jgi:hypothetical protein